MTEFIHADPDRCIGCRTCELACALAHSREGKVTPENFHPRLQVTRTSHITMPVVCHQCENAPCVASCPVQALNLSAHSVTMEESRCIGCNSCVLACPFGAIGIETTAGHAAKIIKCDLCASQAQGPACINVCPTGALSRVNSQQLEEISEQRRKNSCYDIP